MPIKMDSDKNKRGAIPGVKPRDQFEPGECFRMVRDGKIIGDEVYMFTDIMHIVNIMSGTGQEPNFGYYSNDIANDIEFQEVDLIVSEIKPV